MRISRYLHSCFLLEKNGRRILIDPGTWSFKDSVVGPNDVGPVDAVLITHVHADHYYPDAIREFIVMKPDTLLFVPPTSVAQVMEDGFSAIPASVDHRQDIAGFVVEPLSASHNRIPFPAPENIAYRVDGVFLHVGDSLQLDPALVTGIQIVGLPVAGPPIAFADAVAFAKAVRPEIVIPMHEAMLKDSLLGWMAGLCEKAFEGSDIKCVSLLKPGDSFEL